MALNLFQLMLVCPLCLMGETVRVAVASNFSSTMRLIEVGFERATEHELLVSYGSTGKLYGQIRNGAPFDVFLAADVDRPRRLEEEGFSVAGSRFTYAIGQLFLWSPRLEVAKGEQLLRSRSFRYLALANPKLAPYGEASQAVLVRLGIWDELRSEKRIVLGENVGQAYLFVESGNAQVGFVSGSQVIGLGFEEYWKIPAEWYDPIEQQAVRLSNSEGAQALVRFIQSEEGLKLIREGGYAVP